MQGRTVVIIAHRLSTAERADRVAVIDHGALVEEGTHAELVMNRGRYAALFASWTGGHRSSSGGNGPPRGAGELAAAQLSSEVDT
jgi:ABC-type multidrug transport system ATPase subunit